MQLIGVLVLSCMCLQAVSLCAGNAKGSSELADQLTAGICATNHSRVQEFYKSLRDAENRDVQFPDSNQPLLTYSVRRRDINWLVGGLAKHLQPHLGRRLQNVTLDLFTWCVYPLTTTLDIYGCINSTHRWSTPDFEALGFLDVLSLKNNSGPAYRNGNLLINASQVKHLPALKGAMVSCTVTLPGDLTFGVYFDLDLEPSRGSTFLGVSPQSDAFLVKGQPKNFTCLFIGDSVPGYSWYQSNRNGDYRRLCEVYPEPVANVCSRTSTHQLRVTDTDVGECVYTPPSGVRFTNDTNYLVFSSPTVNNTGAYKCTDSPFAQGHTISIDVVFTKLPPKEIHPKEGSVAALACEMKAPRDSLVYFTMEKDHNECVVLMANRTVGDTKESQFTQVACVTEEVVHQIEEVIDDKYSMFYSELEIPKVNEANDDTAYYCNVKYTVDPAGEEIVIKQQSLIKVKE